MLLINIFKSLFKLNVCMFCQLDQAVEFYSCKFCWQHLPWLINVIHQQHRCHKCWQNLKSKEQGLCADCLVDNNECFDQVFGIFNYQAPIKNLLLAIKFHNKLAYAGFVNEVLRHMVVNYWYKHTPLPEVVIPVPLHIDKLRARGFNQAYEFASSVSKFIPIDPKVCARIKPTVSQAGLSKNARQSNVRHAFISHQIPYKHIAILDDVITTGETVKSLSKVIKSYNTQIKIDVWCIARV